MALPKFIKWLRPGLQIKRWIGVIFLGTLFAILNAGMFYQFWMTVSGESNGY